MGMQKYHLLVPNQKEKILVEIDDDFEKNNSELKKIALENLIKTAM